jgi:hypothetical protein
MTPIATVALALLHLASAQHSPPSPGPLPPLTGNIVYHLFERKYTGLGNKDAADYKGDVLFIFSEFEPRRVGNPESSLQANIIEMSEVNVTGWGEYEACNAPGATGIHVCPKNQTLYCCETQGNGPHHGGGPTKHNKTSLPGTRVANHYNTSNGWWFSFPMESEGTTWTEKHLRRIDGKCLGNAWRKAAGGCNSCPGQKLDECVSKCIQSALSATVLKETWDHVFSDPKVCPEVPFPRTSAIVV